MKYFEFGQDHSELMVMLHGGGVCYRGALPTAEELAKHVKAWQDKGYAFTCKEFPNMGHGTLAGEHPQAFSKEVQAAHRQSLQKEKL